MRRGRLLATFVVVTGAACRHQSDAGPAQGQPVPAAAPLLGLVEVDENGAERDLAGFSRSLIDVNSVVRITPNLRPFAEHGRAAQDALAQQLATLRGQLQAINERIPEGLRGISAALEQLRRNPSDSTRLLGEIERLNDEQSQILTPVKDDLERWNLQRTRAALDTATDYGPLGELLRERIVDLERQVSAAVGSGRYTVRMWAVSEHQGATAVQVHLSGYDNLAAGSPTLVDKLSFARTGDEQQRLSRLLDEYQRIALEVRRAQTTGASLRSLAGSYAAPLTADLAAVAALLDSLPDRAALDRFVSRLGAAAHGQFRSSLEALNGPLLWLDSLRGAFATLHSQLARPTNVMAPFDAISSATAALRESQSLVSSPAGRAEFVQAFSTLAGNVEAAGAAVTDVVRQELTTESRRWQAASRRAAVALQRLAQLRLQAGSLLGLQRAATDLGSAPIGADAVVGQLRQVEASAAEPTLLDLRRLERGDGDVLTVTVRVSERDTERTVAEEEHSLEVHTYGWHRRWSAGLAFARPFDGSRFQPGASMSWIMHCRDRSLDQRLGARCHWPYHIGLGLTSVVFTRDTAVELGLGPVVTLFSDALVLGGGFNLQAETWYLLLSTPLLELVGGREGAGGSRLRAMAH